MSRPSLILLFAILMTLSAGAQPFQLQSTGQAKNFTLDIHFGTEGQGAFVKYRGQPAVMALRLKNRSVSGKPTALKTTYLWEEILNGTVNGSYSLTQQNGKVLQALYTSARNGKRFNLQQVPSQNQAVMDSYLLHGVLISFYHTTDQSLVFGYPDGKRNSVQLPGFDHPDPQREAVIADYNFDGHLDIAFTIPDAGMGVYRTFSIYLYNPYSSRFEALAVPEQPKAKCAGLCEVKLDKKNKLLISSCRGGANWWQDVYRYSGANKLTWVKGGEAN